MLLLVALMAMVGLMSTSASAAPLPEAGSTGAMYQQHTVTNSAYSNTRLDVCDQSCAGVQPGYRVTGVRGWNPGHIWLRPYTHAQWRVFEPNFTTDWEYASGGSTGRWISIENLQDFFGGSALGVTVQFVVAVD